MIVLINSQVGHPKHDKKPVNKNGPFVEAGHGELVFNCRTAGLDNHGEAIILLHGFPETSHMWVDLLPILAQRGYRVIAPDQRGYSPRARPDNVKEYSIKKIAADVIAMADAFKAQRFHLVGHDWGSAIGWGVIAMNPDRVISWTALSVPHLKAFGRAYATDSDQQKKSRYISFFQLPFVPELYFSWKDYTYLKKIWTKSSDEQKQVYLSVFRQKNALKAALNWYRANRGVKLDSDDQISFGDVTVPSQLIWGNRDMAIGRAGVELSHQYMKGPYNFIELDAGHWLIQESFPDVSSAIIEYIDTHALKKKE